MGIPVAQEGFTVALSNGSAVEVASECSGFKKTLTVTVFACFYASLFVVSALAAGRARAGSRPPGDCRQHRPRGRPDFGGEQSGAWRGCINCTISPIPLSWLCVF